MRRWHRHGIPREDDELAHRFFSRRVMNVEERATTTRGSAIEALRFGAALAPDEGAAFIDGVVEALCRAATGAEYEQTTNGSPFETQSEW